MPGPSSRDMALSACRLLALSRGDDLLHSLDKKPQSGQQQYGAVPVCAGLFRQVVWHVNRLPLGSVGLLLSTAT